MGTQLPCAERDRAAPNFSAHVCCGQTPGWIKMQLGTEVGLGPGHIVLDGDPVPRPKGAKPPNFQPMSVVVQRLNGSRCHLVRSRPWPRPHCVTWGSAHPPIFGRRLLWPNGPLSQLLLSTCNIFCTVQCTKYKTPYSVLLDHQVETVRLILNRLMTNRINMLNNYSSNFND